MSRSHFDDALTADQRAHAEQSVVAIVEDKRAQAAAERARSAELDKLEAAINAPLSELIQQHADAAEALRQVGAQSLERPEDSCRHNRRTDWAFTRSRCHRRTAASRCGFPLRLSLENPITRRGAARFLYRGRRTRQIVGQGEGRRH